MNIRPQDLGRQIEEKILRQRAPGYDQKPFIATRTSAGLLLGSIAGVLLSVIFQWMIGILLLVVMLIAAGMYISGVFRSPNREQLTDCVSDYEIGLLRDDFQDTLVQDYLTLVKTALSVEPPMGINAEDGVRSALQALGTAIESLPIQPRDIVAENPQRLRAEATRLDTESQTEGDPVVRASRQRRAEALTRRAETAARTAVLLRRHQALREEVSEQISALRTDLTAFHVGGRQAAHDLAGLAASIQNVTIEANAITAARAEIDTLIAIPAVKTATETKALPLRLGRN